MKPPIQYFGAKGAIADRIVALMPPHVGYVEPFAGSLAVLLAKPPSASEVVNDLDGRLMTFWRVLRDRPDELIRVAALTPHSRAELAAAQALDAADEIELARQVWVLLTQGRSLPDAAWRIAEVSLECRPALEVIEQYGAHESNLLYVDQLYSTETREGGRYTVEMSRQDHVDLAESLSQCSAAVMLSGYRSDLYDRLYAHWHHVLLPATSGNARDYARVEVIWSNRPLTNSLFELWEMP